MKDSNTTTLTIRAKVSSSLNNSISSLPPLVRTSKSTLTDKSTNSAINNSINSSNQHNNSNNSDDEVDIDRLIIDLDADIEKSNDRLSSESESHFTPSTNSSKIMSSTINKTKDLNNGTNSATQINQSTTQSNSASSNLSKTSTSSVANSSSQNSNLQTSSTGGDKGLKMKIQRKSIGGKSSGELKSEIVQSDSITSSRHSNSSSNLNFKIEKNGLNPTNSNNLTNNLTTTSSNSSTTNDSEKEKIKHSSGKNKNGSHKEKKTKKEKNSNSITKNSNEFTNNSSNSNGDKDQQSNSSVVLNLDKKNLNSNSNDHLSFNNKINQLKRDNDSLDSPPFKKSKTDDVKQTHSVSSNNTNVNNTSNNKPKVEMRSVSTSTSVSTMTDPECLGFCEPGSAICLEGITWVEAEGVLVVNVTWRGKSYVGTLLDCTKHDWGPPHPRLCDSPTSDLESKGLKSGRGKRTRTSISEQDSRLFQSKLRNGKGRRNFTVPASPIKVDQNKRNRNGTNNNNNNNNNNNKDNSETKPTNSNSQPASSRDTPTLLENSSITNSPLSKQPNSPQLIECPEPNCSKKYKHVNGLKYHQSHCHSGTSYLKGDDLSDDMCKGSNNEDAEEMDVEDQTNVNSPKSKVKIENNDNCNENVTNNLQIIKPCDNENSLVKKPKLNCDNKLDKDDCRENAGSPSAFSDISDANENSNEPELDKSNFSSNKTTDKIKLEEDELKKLNNTENLQKNNKESDLIKNENKQVKEDKSNEDLINKAINGVDKNEMPNLVNNNQSPLMNPQPALNPNFPFLPYGRMPPNSHGNFPLPIDPALQAFLMQDRLLEEQQQSFQANLNNFNNDLKNSIQHKPSNTSISPHNNRFSPQASQQSSIFNQALNTQNQLNKGDTSPYDFIQHEKQREESLKLASNKTAFGNLSSPKQQPSSLVAQHMLNQQHQQQNPSLNSNLKEEQRTTPKHNANKQEENIKPPAMDLMKPTSETHGPPSQQPNHSYYHSLPPFLPATFPPSGFAPAPNSFDPQVLRAVTSNPFNQNFMNNLRFPNSIPGAPQLPIPTSLANSQQELNNKIMGGFNGKQLPFEMMQQQFNLKEMQDRMLNISPNSAKNGLPNQLNNARQSNQMPDLYGALINKAHNLQK